MSVISSFKIMPFYFVNVLNILIHIEILSLSSTEKNCDKLDVIIIVYKHFHITWHGIKAYLLRIYNLEVLKKVLLLLNISVLICAL